MSRPKFQSRAERTDAELGLDPLPSSWNKDYLWHQAALFAIRSLPPDLQPRWRQYFDADAAVSRRLGHRRHETYLRRTGGMVANYADEVHLCWECCGRQELISEVNYDRHGNLRPEDEALVKARAYYHRCEGAR